MRKQTAVFWAQEKGLYILDWDGWRDPYAPSQSTPITEEEFDRRAALCTVANLEDLRKNGWNI